MPVILFFGAMTTALQYLGVIEAIVSRAAALMQMTMTTTAVESIMAALNIFLGYVRKLLYFMDTYVSFCISWIRT